MVGKEPKEIGVNVIARVQGSKLHLEIDLSQEHGFSASGKSKLVASTRGNVELPDGIKLGVNCYRKA